MPSCGARAFLNLSPWPTSHSVLMLVPLRWGRGGGEERKERVKVGREEEEMKNKDKRKEGKGKRGEKREGKKKRTQGTFTRTVATTGVLHHSQKPCLFLCTAEKDFKLHC